MPVADAPPVRGTRWDLFCRIVDNLGDAAAGWRLARQLALEHGARVRLWIDLPDVLATLVPGAAPGACVDGVSIEPWRDDDPRLASTPPDQVADVVVGLLAAVVPDGYRAAMRARRCVWVALEYLSAEPWVASHHLLPSPKSDGLVEHFFFPGFGDDTGGLPREADLIARRDAFVDDPAARRAYLDSLGVAQAPHVRLASLFCYPDTPIRALLDAFAARREPWRVLVPDGVAAGLDAHPVALAVPFVPQRDYDRLLWRCELNFVRGEDSFVRALWAGRPMVWQAYRQPGGAHRPKVRAFVDAWRADAAPDAAAADAFAAMHDVWNAEPGEIAARLPGALDALLERLPAIHDASTRWARVNAARPDLASRLAGFVSGRL